MNWSDECLVKFEAQDSEMMFFGSIARALRCARSLRRKRKSGSPFHWMPKQH
jgi:hypothetical protein